MRHLRFRFRPFGKMRYAATFASRGLTRTRFFFDATHRSDWICNRSQRSGSVLKASAKRSAMSAETDALPLRTRDKAGRVTCRWRATSVTLLLPTS